MAEKTAMKLKVTWIKSAIGHKKEHRKVIKALGLRKLNSTRELYDSPTIRGMLNKVSYLLKIEDA